MNIPDQIKIGGYKVKIKKGYIFGEVDYCIGISLTLENKILLANQAQGLPLSEDARKVNFLHEIVHWIDHVYLGKTLEEREVKGLGEGLFQVLSDNKLHFDK